MLTINDKALSKRIKDDNGFLIIKDNPIAKAGVFEYLLSEIRGEDLNDRENRVIKVYRPFDEMVLIKDNFANKPIMLEHRMIGEGGENSADGAIGSIIKTKDDLYLIADLIIYNTDLIEKIERGEIVELSPAYKCSFKEQKGRYNGDDYEYIQTMDSVNHLAVVERGRSGKDLRIQDTKNKLEVFKMNLKEFAKRLVKVADSCEEVKDNDIDKRELVREIMAISAKPIEEFNGGEEEKVETIAKLAEKLAYAEDEDAETETEAKDNEAEGEEVEAKDNDTGTEAKDNEADVKDSDLEDVINSISEIVAKEVAKQLKEIKEVEKAEAKEVADSYQEVVNVLGTSFDKGTMKARDIYKFGYECITGTALDSALDSKTAFRMVSNTRKKASNVSVKDSNSKSDILEAINKMRGGK